MTEPESHSRLPDLPPDIIEPIDDDVEASRAPLLSHLIELRNRLILSLGALIIGFVLCFLVSKQIFNFLIVPFVDVIEQSGADQTATLYFAPLEFLFTRIKLALLAGFVLAFPYIAWQLYQFVSPGLYKNEKRAVLPFLVSMPILFSAGAAIVYFLIMPFVMQFAANMQQGAGEGTGAAIELFIKVGEYLSLITTLIMAFGFAFQMPVVLTLIAMAGLIDDKFLSKNRSFAIVGIFVFAAILTPPDPVSQIILGGTMMGLYEISILAVRAVVKRNQQNRGTATAE
ncbi:MAG: twin-arginine translocase subunit TatC [bacterium]